MDKEMMAKVNEVLKANGRRELSMDEMDKVVGGECFRIVDIKTEEDLDYFVYTFIASMEKSFGKDVTTDFLLKQLPSYDMIQYYQKGDLDTLHNFLGQRAIDRGWNGF